MVVGCRMSEYKGEEWVIHQVYVDETQDFTQAELSLLISCCQNPNDMFLTGQLKILVFTMSIFLSSFDATCEKKHRDCIVLKHK